MLKIFVRRFFYVCLLSLTVFLSKLIKFGPIFGSLKGSFLATQVILPLLGTFAGSFELISTFLLAGIYGFPFKLSLYSLLTAYHIPSFFASLSLISSRSYYNYDKAGNYLNLISKYINYIIPAICSILFIVNPVGSQIPFYTLYWIIPVAIQFASPKNMFLNSLKATFVAHAIGTCLFVYFVPSDVSLWANLAKIVWLERLVIAATMALVYKTAVFIRNFVTSISAKLIKEA